MATAYTAPKRSQQAGTDAALVAKARLGDADAIAELIRAHSPRLRWVAWRVVRNWADAEDVVQGTLWKACQHLPDFQERSALSTWLTRIAVNEGVGLLRKRRTEPAHLAESDAPLQEAQWPTTQTRTPEQILGSNEIQQTVRQCMACIRDDYRAVLSLAIWDELSHEEIAERLGLSIAAVKTRLHRARRVLQRMLRRQGAGWLSLFVATATLWINTSAAIAAEHEHAMKVGKTGEITFAQETQVGDVTLKPGRYKFQHRVEGSDHFVHFTQWTKPYPVGSSGTPKAHPGETKCRIEELSKKVSQTTVYTSSESGVNRITKVEVGGENVAHLF